MSATPPPPPVADPFPLALVDAVAKSFYSGPLRGVFSALRRHGIIQSVQTLVLDGLSVTSDMCYELINDPMYNVRVLSIRDAKNLNQGKLCGALRYACRSSRPEHLPRLKALYVFGPKDSLPSSPSASDAHHATSPAASVGAEWNHKSQVALTSSLRRHGDAWWSRKGKIISRQLSDDWVSCLLACHGIIAFDTILCQGPCHLNSPAHGTAPSSPDSTPAIATLAVSGCASCGKAPEGLIEPNSRPPVCLPLLSPPPISSSTVRAATTPQQPWTPFTARCSECLRGRYCDSCSKWWCEACYRIPTEFLGDNASPVIIASEESTLNAREHQTPAQIIAKEKVRNGLCESCIAERSGPRAAP